MASSKVCVQPAQELVAPVSVAQEKPALRKNSIANAGPWAALKPGVSPSLLEALEEQSMHSMTAVQASTIPLFLRCKDVVAEAVTGSGKTLAYLVPTIELLLRRIRASVPSNATFNEDCTPASYAFRKNQVAAIIVAPTRELAQQIYTVLQSLVPAQVETVAAPSTSETASSSDTQNAIAPKSSLSYLQGTLKKSKKKRKRPDTLPHEAMSGMLGLTHMLAVGGGKKGLEDDVARFRESGAHIVVATPGRLLAFLEHKAVCVRECEILVLDEADRLLDQGFSETLDKLFQMLPRQRRTAMFSATMTDALAEVTRSGLRNPVRVVVKQASANQKNASGTAKRTPDSLKIEYAGLEREFWVHAMISLISNLEKEHVRESQDDLKVCRAIVYVSTCNEATYLHKLMTASKMLSPKVQWCALHGHLRQAQRDRVFADFARNTESEDPSQQENKEEEDNQTNDTPANKPGVHVLVTTDVAARGLDLPNVQLVVQMGAPTDPSVFAHRCGRAARAGRTGRAVALLTPIEADLYLPVLAIRGVQVNELESAKEFKGKVEEMAAETSQIAQTLSEAVKSDRELVELGVRAFVAHVRAYSAHKLSYVFLPARLSLPGLAKMILLKRVPRMPEITNAKESVQQELSQVVGEDLDAIRFRNEKREAQRRANLEKSKAKEQENANKMAELAEKRRKIEEAKKLAETRNTAWSKKRLTLAKKQFRKLKSKLKQKVADYALAAAAAAAAEPGCADENTVAKPPSKKLIAAVRAAKQSVKSLEPAVKRKKAKDSDDEDGDFGFRTAEKLQGPSKRARSQAVTASFDSTAFSNDLGLQQG